MKARVLNRLRNIGIAAHIDAGKTTLTERILYYAGRIHRVGETHDGGSQMDTRKMEKEKGITISAASTQVNWSWMGEEYTYNIIDTPGHVDFMIEVERALRVLDGMICLFDAVSGVEPQTETVWRQANRYGVPRIAFVNKMDRMGADMEKVITDIRQKLKANALAIQLPIGKEDDFVGIIDLIEMEAFVWDEKDQCSIVPIPEDLMKQAEEYRIQLLESLSEFDEELMEKYLDDKDAITAEEIRKILRQATLSMGVVPVLCGSAYKNKAVQPLMGAVAAYLPSPSDSETITGTDPDSGEEMDIRIDPESPFSALAFKVAFDRQNRKLTFIRIYSGTLSAGDTVRNMRIDGKQRIGHLYLMHADKQESIKKAIAGDIVALMGVKDIRTGDTLVDMDHAMVLESLFIPEPVIGMALEPKKTGDLDRLGIALSKLSEEDPTFKVKVDNETGQTIIRGMGELHLEYLISRIEDDFNIPCTTGRPMVSYREELTQSVVHRERLKKFTGGPGLFAEIEVEISPADASYLESPAFLEKGRRLQFVDEIVGGVIPKEYISSVEKGFRSVMDNGLLAGYPIEHMKVRLIDGKTHSNESKPLAFELVAKEAFRNAFPKTEPGLLEPMMQVEVTTPDEYLGAIIGDLNRKRALIKGQESESGSVLLKADVPLSEMFGYIGQLRAMSSGRAAFSMIFSHYAGVPSKMAESIIGENVQV